MSRRPVSVASSEQSESSGQIAGRA